MSSRRFQNIALMADTHAPARNAQVKLKDQHNFVEPDGADVIVTLGGDGFMLSTMHAYMDQNIPIFGMNLGSVGFLMNEFRAENLINRLEAAEEIRLNPLTMIAETSTGDNISALAINEVSLLRELRYAAKIRILVDGVVRLKELICDGVMISTAAGSTAYNLSAYGPIIPLGAELLALTPISAFRPRRWRGALLPQNSIITFEIIDHDYRSVSAVADSTEVRDVVRVEIKEERSLASILLFDPEHNLEERILNEQFLP
ncbi:MAG: NAD kinase [Rhodospirillales bacterium]|nr:NAD kinase [Rhodospirillales bacterium]